MFVAVTNWITFQEFWELIALKKNKLINCEPFKMSVVEVGTRKIRIESFWVRNETFTFLFVSRSFALLSATHTREL